MIRFSLTPCVVCWLTLCCLAGCSGSAAPPASPAAKQPAADEPAEIRVEGLLRLVQEFSVAPLQTPAGAPVLDDKGRVRTETRPGQNHAILLSDAGTTYVLQFPPGMSLQVQAESRYIAVGKARPCPVEYLREHPAVHSAIAITAAQMSSDLRPVVELMTVRTLTPVHRN